MVVDMIPDFQSIMLPMLRLLDDGSEQQLSAVREQLATEFGLTDEEQEELLPSGRQTVFSNRVAWASVHLDKAGLLEKPQRGWMRVTDRDKTVLESNPVSIGMKDLEKYESYREFRAGSGKKKTKKEVDQTPEEVLEEAYQTLREGLASELLQQVKTSTPTFFERLVVDLLVKMGYGGTRKEAGRAIGKSGDEGIDGIINEDRLGLDVVYLQAKPWEGVVGRPEIQKFVGALTGKRARKGVFLTTGSFSKDARAYAGSIDPKVVLIDGEQLAEYMIDFGLGVSTTVAYDVKRIDSDFFVEE
jgi:restriction system protein